MRPGDAAWSRAEAAWLTPEDEECPECGGWIEETDTLIRCASDTGCGWSIPMPPEPDTGPEGWADEPDR